MALKSVATAAAFLCMVWVPNVSAAPASSTRTLVCDDGSIFTVAFAAPDSASGINATFKISGAIGPAARATSFAVYRRVIYDELGAIVMVFGSVSHDAQRDLVTCTSSSPTRAGYLVEDAGVFVARAPRS